MRTGAYKKLNVIDIRDGELISYDRLTEDIEIEFIEDEAVRETKKIVGYVGYFRLVNGMEKTIYRSVAQIKAHELAHRKGRFQNPIWKDTPDNAANFKAMCAKSVLRELIGKWGIMSIDYQTADASTIAAAEAIAKGQTDDDDTYDTTAYTQDGRMVNPETGEITPEEQQAIDEVIDNG